MTRDELENALETVLDKRARIDCDIHFEHHEWIKQRIQAEKKREEFYTEAIKIIIQMSIPVVLGGMWYFLQHGKWPQ